MSKFDCDGFQIVATKRFSRNKPTKLPPKGLNIEKEENNIDPDKAISRIQNAVDDLKNSKYLVEVIDSVSKLLQCRKVVELVCFGLGHVGECQISRHQLSLLICLKDTFKPDKVYVHDPIFYKSECRVLNLLNIDIIDKNIEGHYTISNQDFSILYLPHCPKQLTNNFLWSNWSNNLQNCILICNSFTALSDNQPNRILSETVPFIHKIIPHTVEIALENNFKFTDIFNDTSIHYFPKEKLEKVDSDFWYKGDKPKYEDCEEFITSLMIDKLNI